MIKIFRVIKGEVMQTKFLPIFLIIFLGGCAHSSQLKSYANAYFSIVAGTKIFAEARVNSDGSIHLTKVD